MGVFGVFFMNLCVCLSFDVLVFVFVFVFVFVRVFVSRRFFITIGFTRVAYLKFLSLYVLFVFVKMFCGLML